jgi:ABC-2 type transport system ATP-binding protein
MVDVAKRFGPTRAVDGVSLEVAAGEVLGLLGPNGAGKSTSLRMIAGLVRPDLGRIHIGGHDLARDRTAALASAGFLIEGPALPPELGCRAALVYMGLLDGGVAPARVDELLAEVGLADAGGKRVKHLSLGMKQRLALAAALLGRPRLLVLDEPMNGLDPGGARQMAELLRRLARQGVALLVSSHLLEQVERFADRVAVLFQGKVATQERLDGGAPGALARRFFAITGEGSPEGAGREGGGKRALEEPPP